MFYKRTLPLTICFVMGVLAFCQQFVAHHIADVFLDEVNMWFRVMGCFGAFLGAYSLIHLHVSRLRLRQKGWGYSAFFFAGLIIMLALGIKEEVLRGMEQFPDGTFSWVDWFYDNVLVPCQATLFSILAFFIASAAFRTFRVRNATALLLLVAAILVMLGRVPVSEALGAWLFPRHPLVFPQAADILMNYPNLAAKRGILIGICLGGISQSLRILLAIERTYLGEGGRD
jgi:hypothetical protein